MLNSRIIFALSLILAVTVLPATLLPVHAQEVGTMNVAIAGPGQVYWKGTNNGATINEGWVSASGSTITLPPGTMITFLEFHSTGHYFTNWIVNGYDQGSDSPFVLIMGQGASGSVTANFDGTLVKNAEGTYTNPTITSPVQTPAVFAPPVQYATFQINVQGSGTVLWTTSYGSSTESGSTNSAYSILVPYGATITFSATPTSGNAFSNWNVNAAYAGSTNLYVITNINTLSPSTVTAVFA